jgi:hypothetical protein
VHLASHAVPQCSQRTHCRVALLSLVFAVLAHCTVLPAAPHHCCCSHVWACTCTCSWPLILLGVCCATMLISIMTPAPCCFPSLPLLQPCTCVRSHLLPVTLMPCTTSDSHAQRQAKSSEPCSVTSSPHTSTRAVRRPGTTWECCIRSRITWRGQRSATWRHLTYGPTSPR